MTVLSNGDLSKQFGTPVEVTKLVMEDVVAVVEEVPELTKLVAVVMDMPVVESLPDRITMLYTVIALAPPQF